MLQKKFDLTFEKKKIDCKKKRKNSWKNSYQKKKKKNGEKKVFQKLFFDNH